MNPDRDRRARLATAGAYFVQGLCFAALVTRIPAIQARYDFKNDELSLVLLAVPVFAGVGSVLAGSLASRFGSALVLRIAGPLVCASVAAVGASGNRPLLYATLVAFGLAVGAVDATMNMQGVAVQARYGRSILASFHAVWSVAGILGAVITVVAADRMPLGVHLGLVGLLGVAAALLVGPGLLRRDEEAPAVDVAGVTVPWRPILLIGGAMMLMYIADSSTSNWSALYLHKVLHSTQGFAAWAYAAYQTLQVLGRVGADRLGERFGAVRSVAVGAIVGAAGLAVVVAAPDSAPGRYVAVGGFALLGLGLCVVVPHSFTAVARFDPNNSGVAVARVNLFNYAGFVLGAPMVGLVPNLRIGFAIPLVLVLAIVPMARWFAATPAQADTN